MGFSVRVCVSDFQKQLNILSLSFLPDSSQVICSVGVLFNTVPAAQSDYTYSPAPPGWNIHTECAITRRFAVSPSVVLHLLLLSFAPK